MATKNGNMLMSAAHVIEGRSAAGIIFAPGYTNGQAPYDPWHVHKAYTDARGRRARASTTAFALLKPERTYKNAPVRSTCFPVRRRQHRQRGFPLLSGERDLLIRPI
ncbi:MAG: hypothetical protein JO037_08680 [Actinobacteria bacterium]|nr:hypothetical protein [Actinomycetota bacterium]